MIMHTDKQCQWLPLMFILLPCRTCYTQDLPPIGNATYSSKTAWALSCCFVRGRNNRVEKKFRQHWYKVEGWLILYGVCVSVCPSYRKSWITFEWVNGFEWNFKGLLGWSAVTFGWVVLPPSPPGPAPSPWSGAGPWSFVLPSCVIPFSESCCRAKQPWQSRFLILWLPGFKDGANFLRIWQFFIKHTPPKIKF